MTDPRPPLPSTVAARFSSVAHHGFMPFPAAVSVTQVFAHVVRAAEVAFTDERTG